ncbi:MAG: hypothetical protein AAGD35_06130 [Actinomycetota bacterium]
MRKLSSDQHDIVMARGRRIETVDDLEVLFEADAARLQPIVEVQSADM